MAASDRGVFVPGLRADYAQIVKSQRKEMIFTVIFTCTLKNAVKKSGEDHLFSPILRVIARNHPKSQGLWWPLGAKKPKSAFP
jgi:hypothetical protein